MVFPTDGVSGVMESVHAIPENVTKRVVAISIRSGVKAPEDSSELLNLKGLKVADLSCLDTSSTIRLASLFEGCSELLSVELGGIDTSKVQSVDHMFYACSSLTFLDLSSLDFRSVRVANALVSECYALPDLRLPKTFGRSCGAWMPCLRETRGFLPSTFLRLTWVPWPSPACVQRRRRPGRVEGGEGLPSCRAGRAPQLPG
ncbi:hypothetical protein HMPREF1008_00540 [Olsenella sp. oral taxon 809 str. F0356]|uniref:BspA family leucine-rich repeat surface protein n=1 Tax=Olsenella sp. oral taxon 809 TaxID=661086 RepID=UPI000231F2EE|nr:BspA family leucine-rich repeat surface protein [Olsenella sp. oral taxon 809]EHF02895.1 hypothetical protein HMPREF1008_00540 [Olsenella sp. oral taxon 809 str. F0356]